MSLRYLAGFITASYNPLKVPNAPTIGTATAGDTQATITFTAPSNVGGGAITGYIAVATKTSDGTAVSATGSASPITVTGLTNNTAYTIKVAATNAYGTGAYSAASNSVTPVPPFIEDVFSTYLYTGNDSTQTITNGIDLSGKGGLVWEKSRTLGANHLLWDSSRGTYKLSSNLTDAQVNNTIYAPTFTSTGYISNYGWSSANNIASWTFREQAKFFDIVTYTGDGASSRAISHNLGSVPGCIIVKRTNNVGDWETYHRELNGGVNPQNCKILLNSAGAQTVGTGAWASTSPTSSVFYTNGTANTNDSGATYVAYLFAHNAGGFGASGNDNVISCGSYTGNGSATGPVINLGYEPQWIMIKSSSLGSQDWLIYDNMRGIPVGSGDAELCANLIDAETSQAKLYLTPTGFGINSSAASINGSSQTYIYIAIRRGPMKTPTTGTSVFAPVLGTGGTTGIPTSFTVDSSWVGYKPGGFTRFAEVSARLTGSYYMGTSSTSSESYNASIEYAKQTGFGSSYYTSDMIGWEFQRAPGFFDVVCYTGNNQTPQNVSHNLTVVPELVISRCRSVGDDWIAGFNFGVSTYSRITLNSTGAALSLAYGSGNMFNSAPTSTQLAFDAQNTSPRTYVTYLFASCPGVSKVGSYTGTGTTLQINCGFTAGARFVLIKRTDSTGDWYVWDSARGIVAGNDPYLLLNSTAAEVTNTDYVDASAAGFEISSTAPAAINANGGTFIYLAIA